MQIGIYGLGRMGLNMAIRLLQAGHEVVAYNRSAGPREVAASHGAKAVGSLEELISALEAPRALWLMLPEGAVVDAAINEAVPRMSKGDTIIDGGNSNYKDTQRRSNALEHTGIHYVDCGTSGGIWGLEIGYCLMVGGPEEPVKRLEPIFKSLAPPDGYLHAGPSGAGHFTKMVHNGIEYGLLQAYAEGFEILEASQYDLDLAKIAHLWNQGSVVRSWLLELAESALAKDPKLTDLKGYIEDSGEGRWTVLEAIDKSVPAPIITLSLLTRFRSRQEDSFGGKVVAALRREFGGHAVTTAEGEAKKPVHSHEVSEKGAADAGSHKK
jgi:6-phosphogluconate dehydrogenase